MLDEIYKVDRKTGAISVLLTLIVDEELLLSQLCARLKFDRTTTVRAVELLLELGLLSIRTSKGFPFSRHLRLSEAGRQFVGIPLTQWPGFFLRRRPELRGTE